MVKPVAEVGFRALNFVQWDRPEGAVRVAREGLKALGEDPSLERVLHRRGRR